MQISAIKDSLQKIWLELEGGNDWGSDANLRNFFRSALHQGLITLFNQRISDGLILKLLESIIKAVCLTEGTRLTTEQVVPEGAVVSSLVSNVLFPFD